MKTQLLVLTVVCFSLFACQKEKDEIDAIIISAEAVEDNADFENAMSALENVIVDAADRDSDSSTYAFVNCASFSINPTWISGVFPKTITVDFGTTNCLGVDGNYRRGKVMVTLTGRYRDSGTVITTTLDNYYQNDNKIEGKKIKTNLGRNGQGNLEYEVNVENGLITHVNNYRLSWRSTRIVEWVDGESTLLNIFDDEYMIDGAANGVTRSGKLYTMDITKSLNLKLNCKWIRSGTISLKPEDYSVRTVDYGDGACDPLATYSANGNDYQFSMR